jgi:hypothetical protein
MNEDNGVRVRRFKVSGRSISLPARDWETIRRQEASSLFR